MKISQPKKRQLESFYTARGPIDSVAHTMLLPVAGLPGVKRHQSPPPLQCFVDSDIGLAKGTDVRTKQQEDGTWEARQSVSIFGGRNMTEEQVAATGDDPFHPDFHDNYISGKGATEADALAAMKKDGKEMADSLWAE